MNVALKSYLSEMLDDAKVNTGYAYALQKCATIIRRARSPMNPARIESFRNFGHGQIAQRVKGHFGKEDHRSELSEASPADLSQRVKEELADVLAQGRFRGKVLTRALRTRIEKTSDALGAFLSLEDVRDVALLTCCNPELLAHLEVAFPRVRKKRAATSIKRPMARRTAIKRKRSIAFVEPDAVEDSAEVAAPDLSLPIREEGTPDKAPRPCRVLSGGWAIMVGLHLAGAPQTKKQLVELSAKYGLCREPLVKPQRTVSRIGQWYDAWSSHMRLSKVGWLLRTGKEYSLTSAGQAEASRYAQQREDAANRHPGLLQSPSQSFQTSLKLQQGKSIFQNMSSKSALCSANSSRSSPCSSMSVSTTHASFSDLPCIGTSISNACASIGSGESAASAGAAPLTPPPAAFKFPSSFSLRKRCDAIDLSDNEEEEEPVSHCNLFKSPRHSAASSSHAARSSADQLHRTPPPSLTSNSSPEDFRVLVDLCEKTVVRESIASMLPSSVQMRLPGVDYAFGKLVDGEWLLANVLVERKTVHDYLKTANSERGEFQACIHESLAAAGFLVVVILEGINELSHHPQHAEIMAAAHSSTVPVLTSASINDTIELLLAFAANAHVHDGWTMRALQVMLQHHYEVDPIAICEAALVALGMARHIAHSVASTCSPLHGLLAELLAIIPPGTADCVVAHACLERLALQSGLTLFQMGKVLRALGIQDAELSRKRIPHSSASSTLRMCVHRRWPAGVLVKAYLRCSHSMPRTLKRRLEALAEVHEVDGLSSDMVHICTDRLSVSYVFRIGGGSCLDPGAHWLVLAKELDWKAVTASRARAFVCDGVVSTLCTSAEQVVQHIAARLKAMDSGTSELVNRRLRGAGSGLAGVFRLARTAGGTLPFAVARDLAEHESLHGLGLVQVARRLTNDGAHFLQSLGVRELGVERAAAVKALLLGGV